ncbi:hypothetical protein PAPYR_7666 [Paratrimastix pyriformis]|uniref:Uncharacterized protein n=1 Tax=Paratrimastix pyriformis TaxID=342808 RepID=A0ABQ8UCC8_9EUKA|nr:hypothetical protein PAPYR_7666 [Paratrimastix pyriformis]
MAGPPPLVLLLLLHLVAGALDYGFYSASNGQYYDLSPLQGTISVDSESATLHVHLGADFSLIDGPCKAWLEYPTYNTCLARDEWPWKEGHNSTISHLCNTSSISSEPQLSGGPLAWGIHFSHRAACPVNECERWDGDSLAVLAWLCEPTSNRTAFTRSPLSCLAPYPGTGVMTAYPAGHRVGACQVCDPARNLDGWSAYQPSAPCRPAVDECDLAEFCTAASADCPPDMRPVATLTPGALVDYPAAHGADRVRFGWSGMNLTCGTLHFQYALSPVRGVPLTADLLGAYSTAATLERPYPAALTLEATLGPEVLASHTYYIALRVWVRAAHRHNPHNPNNPHNRHRQPSLAHPPWALHAMFEGQLGATGCAVDPADLWVGALTYDPTPPDLFQADLTGGSCVVDRPQADRTYLSAPGRPWLLVRYAASDLNSTVAGFEVALGATADDTDLLGWTTVAPATRTADLSAGCALLDLTPSHALPACPPPACPGDGPQPATLCCAHVAVDPALAAALAPDGTPFQVRVRARNGAGLAREAAPQTAVFATSAPTVSFLWHGPAGPTHLSNVPTEISGAWDVAEPLSGVQSLLWGFGEDAAGLAADQLAEIPLAPVHSAPATLLHGHTYYQTLIAVGASGLQRRVVSAGLTVDLTPPNATSAEVHNAQPDARCSAQRECYQASPVPRLAWSGFAEDLAPVVRYEVALGSTPGAQDLAPYRSVGLMTNASLDDLVVPTGTVFYAAVRAYNSLEMVRPAVRSPPLHVGIPRRDDVSGQLHSSTIRPACRNQFDHPRPSSPPAEINSRQNGRETGGTGKKWDGTRK